MRAVLQNSFLKIYGSLPGERVRSLIRGVVVKLEGGPEFSLTIRRLLATYHGLEIGLYTRWPYHLKPGIYQPGTRIGRYASVADTARTFTRNHTTNTKSTHGFFDNPLLGKVDADLIPWGELFIGHGASIGHNAIILPPTKVVGEGAVVLAGSVVCADVPPYAIVSGFPARVTSYRFDKERIATLIASQWWTKTPAELQNFNADSMTTTLGSSEGRNSPFATPALVTK